MQKLTIVLIFALCACGGTAPANMTSEDLGHMNGTPGSMKYAADLAGAPAPSPLDLGSGAKQPLYAPCNVNGDCQSNLCGQFPAHGGGFCTKPCMTAQDCPAPSSGCNNMHICKPF